LAPSTSQSKFLSEAYSFFTSAQLNSSMQAIKNSFYSLAFPNYSEILLKSLSQSEEIIQNSPEFKQKFDEEIPRDRIRNIYHSLSQKLQETEYKFRHHLIAPFVNAPSFLKYSESTITGIIISEIVESFLVKDYVFGLLLINTAIILIHYRFKNYK
jgi:hypothetical protein